MAGINVDKNTLLIDYSIQEDATPLDPGDAGGAYGQLNYTTSVRDKRLGDVATLSDSWKAAEVPGKVSNLTHTEGLTSVTADSLLYAMNSWRTVLPYSGELQGYLDYLVALCGVDRAITADKNTENRFVSAAGYEGSVWEGFKEFLSANNLEVVFRDANILVRKPHTAEHKPKYLTSISKNHSSQSVSEKVRVQYRQLLYPDVRTDIEFYPDHADYTEGILSVDAGETVVLEVILDGSVSRLNQPVCVDYVPANTDYSGTGGVYCVSGNDGKPIEASRWAAGGGKLMVRTTSDPSVIEVILIGSKVEEYAPYQIAATAGESSYYNSLHITGDGLKWTEQEFTMYTGAVRSASEEEDVAEIENPQILSLAQAQDAAIRTSRYMCGGQVTLSGSSAPRGPGAGDRVFYEDAFYRVNTTTNTPSNSSFDAAEYTLISDFNRHKEGDTVRDFNEVHARKTFLDFNERPLA